MEFVMVTYPAERAVFVDGEQNGTTNDVIRIDAGTHEFDLGEPLDYEPASRRVSVRDTTVLEPAIVAFTEAGQSDAS